MKMKKIIISIIFIILIIALTSYILIGKIFLNKKMNEYLKNKGYEISEIAKVKVSYSFISYILSYGAWGISVEYIDEPGVKYFYKYEDNKIVTNGIGGSPAAEKENLKHDQDYRNVNIILTSFQDEYSLADQQIQFIIENKTNNNFLTHASPTLEFKENDNWKKLELNATAGFCGNKDTINKSIERVLTLSWYDNLKAGKYRVSYNIYNEKEIKLYEVSKEFTLK